MSKIIYDVYKNTNEDSPSHGNFFGRIVHLETLNTRKLARHISEHGSVYTQDVVEGVLTKAEACIVEMLLESKKIKLEGLGTFYLMAENKKGGVVSLDKFNPKDLKRAAAEGRPADEESGGTEGGPSTEGGGPSTEG